MDRLTLVSPNFGWVVLYLLKFANCTWLVDRAHTHMSLTHTHAHTHTRVNRLLSGSFTLIVSFKTLPCFFPMNLLLYTQEQDLVRHWWTHRNYSSRVVGRVRKRI